MGKRGKKKKGKHLGKRKGIKAKEWEGRKGKSNERKPKGEKG